MSSHFFDFGFLDLLIVEEEQKRRGIGVALLDYLSRQCKTESCLPQPTNPIDQKTLCFFDFNK